MELKSIQNKFDLPADKNGTAPAPDTTFSMEFDLIKETVDTCEEGVQCDLGSQGCSSSVVKEHSTDPALEVLSHVFGAP